VLRRTPHARTRCCARCCPLMRRLFARLQGRHRRRGRRPLPPARPAASRAASHRGRAGRRPRHARLLACEQSTRIAPSRGGLLVMPALTRCATQ
jgi:hypothetical protein